MADSKKPVPATFGRRTFSTAFRGFDQEEVRSYLEALAKEFRELRERISELETELEAERGRVVETPHVDVVSITSALGEETARVLRTAQEAADDLRTRAEDGAARALKEAYEEASRIRGEAEGVLAERTAEAETIRSEADTAATKRREEAAAAADKTIADAIAQGRDMLGQAQAARERVLTDLARRRKIALAQLDSLRAGRERLDSSLRAARTELDRIADDLARSDAEARAAEEAVGHIPVPEPGSLPEPMLSVPEPAAAAPPEPAAASPEPDAARPEPAADASTPDAPIVAASQTETAERAPAAVSKEQEGAAVAGAAAPATNDTGTTRRARRKAQKAGAHAPYAHDPVPAAALPSTAVGPEPEPADATDAVVADAAATTAADTEAGDEAAPAAGGAPEEPAKVDELFARIRADRAQKVTEARAVLDEAPAVPEEAANGGTAERGSKPGPAPRAGSKPAAERGAGSKPAADRGAGSKAATAPRAAPKPAADRGGGSGPAAKAAAGPVATAEDDTAPGSATANGAALEAPRTDADESWLQTRDALLEEPVAAVLRSIKRGLADDQNVALEHLRTARANVLGVDALLGTPEEHGARAASWSAAGLARVARAGARLAGGDGPVPDAVVATAATGLGRVLTEPVRARLAQLLEANGGDRGQDTADGINSAFREARASIDRLVGDTVTVMVSAGERHVLGDGSPVRWVVDDADGPCPDCDDNALAGATPLGQAFPTGQDAPPAHPGCRCVLAPAPA